MPNYTRVEITDESGTPRIAEIRGTQSMQTCLLVHLTRPHPGFTSGTISIGFSPEFDGKLPADGPDRFVIEDKRRTIAFLTLDA